MKILCAKNFRMKTENSTVNFSLSFRFSFRFPTSNSKACRAIFKFIDTKTFQISLSSNSFRSDGLVTCYVDCIWDSSYVMAPNSFEIPQPRTRLELNSKLNGLIEWKQLSLISGNHERSQCSSERTPIYDNNKFFERTMFNDDVEEAN